MKKSLSVLIILLLLFNTFGFELFFSFVLIECKEDASHALKVLEAKNELQVLRIKKENISEVVRLNEKEIKYHGELFDVYRKEDTKDEILIYCYRDAKEQKILKQIQNDSLRNNTKGTKESEARFVLKNLLKNYLNTDCPVVNESARYEKLNAAEFNLYESLYLNKIPHPPQPHFC